MTDDYELTTARPRLIRGLKDRIAGVPIPGPLHPRSSRIRTRSGSGVLRRLRLLNGPRPPVPEPR
jgi:hypothetical protein